MCSATVLGPSPLHTMLYIITEVWGDRRYEHRMVYTISNSCYLLCPSLYYDL